VDKQIVGLIRRTAIDRRSQNRLDVQLVDIGD
jgi:hypothetical protein